MKFGVCYYPEHWPRERWQIDAAQMADAGISVIRIGEFAWSRLETARDEFNFDWLDDAIETLASHGHQLILGTPTATPPKWLIDQYPDILAVSKDGQTRRFGSRRHYCFSSSSYRCECERIVTVIVERYGEHPAITGWQIDNEYGCHDTVRSYSPDALIAFRIWLRERYETITKLNEAWGNVFWSQEYSSFDSIDLPKLTTTEPNPAHVLDFYRFSSDQVLSFHGLQADIVRRLSPGRDVYHNVMGHFTDFDHFALGQDVDILGWDSYPLGFLDNQPYTDEDKAAYYRQGHPDFAAFHHDLYRACASRWGLLELQPGPVNWAPHNPVPSPGMVRLWLHEAAAHGADVSCVFRWRQVPFGQEQNHAGLLRVDGHPAPGLAELRQAIMDHHLLLEDTVERAEIAILFDYETQWMSEIQPQGDWNYFFLTLNWYGAVRQYGCNIDIVRRGQDLSAYKLVLVPSLFHISANDLSCFENTDAIIVFGPRSGSKTDCFSIPSDMTPGQLRKIVPISIPWSSSFSPTQQLEGTFRGQRVEGRYWLDEVETSLKPQATSSDGAGLLYRQENIFLFTTVPCEVFLQNVIEMTLAEKKISVQKLPADQRRRLTAHYEYEFDYSNSGAEVTIRKRK